MAQASAGIMARSSSFLIWRRKISQLRCDKWISTRGNQKRRRVQSYLGSDPKKVRKAALSLVNAGAAGVIVVRKADPAYFEEAARQSPESAIHLQGETRSALAVELNFLEVSAEAANILQELPEDTTLHFEAPSTTEESYTW